MFRRTLQIYKRFWKPQRNSAISFKIEETRILWSVRHRNQESCAYAAADGSALLFGIKKKSGTVLIPFITIESEELELEGQIWFLHNSLWIITLWTEVALLQPVISLKVSLAPCQDDPGDLKTCHCCQITWCYCGIMACYFTIKACYRLRVVRLH